MTNLIRGSHLRPTPGRTIPRCGFGPRPATLLRARSRTAFPRAALASDRRLSAHQARRLRGPRARRGRHVRARDGAVGACGERSEGRHHRRRDSWHDEPVPDLRQPGLCRGDQVHLERRQGLQPKRDVVGGPERGQRRLDRRVHGPRQRLAQPGTPTTRTTRRRTASASTPPPATATTTTSTTASPRSGRSPPPPMRSCS